MSATYRPPAFTAPIDLDLSRNEGAPTVTSADMASIDIAAVTSRYPEPAPLRDLIAARHGITPDRVLVTAGGDDGLFRCFLANRAGAAVATTPSFEMIRCYAAQVQTPLIEIPWWAGDFPVDDFLEEAAAEPGMAIVVSPNNPTGSTMTAADLRKLSGSYPLVVLDAAYVDFADDDLTDEALELEDVVVLRTLSKAYGLAGLRVGYMLGSSRWIDRLTGFGSPYSLSGLSISLATEVLTRKPERGAEYARQVAAGRDQIAAALERLGARPLPSQANFVLATDVDPGWLVPAAASLGVALRRWADRPDLDTCVRITVPGDPADQERLLATLRAALAPEAVLFDMDGVLVDVRRSYREAIVATAAYFGVEVKPGDITAAKAAGDASDDWDLTRRLCLAAGVDLDLAVVRDRFETIYQGDQMSEGLKHRETSLVDRARLERLAERLPLGIVTARPRKDAVDAMERLGFDGLFATVVCREDGPSKPDPAPVRLAMERLGVDRAWMLGDTVDDLQAARAAGVVPIAVLVPGDDVTALTGAARVITSATEIEEMLDVTNG